MSKKHTIALLGGSGFVGHHVCALLAQQGHTVRVFSRRPHACKELTLLPTVSVEDVDVHDPKELARAAKGCDVMINLVGILNEKGHNGKGFEKAHVQLAHNIIYACEVNHITRLLHMSALNADAKNGPSHYLRTKGIAEDFLHSKASPTLKVTSFRPSVIFGPEDNFLNQFATLLKFSPGIMVLPSAQALFAPIYVCDVAQAMVMSLDMRETYGERYDLCGPTVYTLKALVQYTAQVTQRKRMIIGLNNTFSNMVAHIMEYLPFKPYSVDNFKSSLVPSVCESSFPIVFNRRPVHLESIVPQYLGKTRYQDPFFEAREKYSQSKS